MQFEVEGNAPSEMAGCTPPRSVLEAPLSDFPLICSEESESLSTRMVTLFTTASAVVKGFNFLCSQSKLLSPNLDLKRRRSPVLAHTVLRGLRV